MLTRSTLSPSSFRALSLLRTYQQKVTEFHTGILVGRNRRGGGARICGGGRREQPFPKAHKTPCKAASRQSCP